MSHFSHRVCILCIAFICIGALASCHKQESAGQAPGAEAAANGACYSINLANPESPASIVQVRKTDDELTINVHTESKLCIELSGAFDGGVVLNNQKNVDIDIHFKDVQITSDKNAGYLDLKSNDKNIGNTYTIELSGQSAITGAAQKKSKSVISADPNLVFKGDGSLSVVAKYKNGIVSNDVLTIASGTIDIRLNRAEAAKADKYNEKGFGIKVDNGFEMTGGKVTIEANDNITNYESRGIKVDGSDKTAYNAGKGYVKISGGELTIHSDAKALSAGWEIDEDAKTETTADDPHPDVFISGGVIDIVTSAEPRGGRKFGPPPEMKFDENGKPMMPDFMRGELKMDENGNFVGPDGQMLPPPPPPEFKRRPGPNMKKDKKKAGNGDSSETTVSPEGIEAKRNLVISGGKVHVVAMDDGLNAGETITISGGEVFVWSQSNDALDANNHATISGGLTVLFGAMDPDGALDADMNRNVSYTGGTLVALGGANNAPEGADTTGTFAQIALVESKGGFHGGFGGPGRGPGRGPGMRREMMPNDAGAAPATNDAGAAPATNDAGAAPAPNDAAAAPVPNDAAAAPVPNDIGAAPVPGAGPGGGFPPFNRKREISELANATITLADAENGNAIVSIKVPEKFTGGGSILVLSDKLQKDKTYRFYTNPTFDKPVAAWIHNAISAEQVQVSGEKYTEVNAGVALPSPFGPMPGMAMGMDKEKK